MDFVMHRQARIYVSGHAGLVGAAIVRLLQARGFFNIITADHACLDLTDQQAVRRFFDQHRPEFVFACAARVGGVLANIRLPAELLSANLQIQCNMLDAARRSGVCKVLLFGSNCMYPTTAPQPLSEDSLHAGPLEPSIAAYATAKLAGLRLAQAYRAQFGLDAIVMIPANLYGPNDNFDGTHSHVMAALLRKFVDAQRNDSEQVCVWGDGTARREFLHVDDLARASLHCMLNYSGAGPLNAGSGSDISIAELVQLIADASAFRGHILWQSEMPTGAQSKLLDSTRIAEVGWKAEVPLEQGVRSVYRWLLHTEVV